MSTEKAKDNPEWSIRAQLDLPQLNGPMFVKFWIGAKDVNEAHSKAFKFLKSLDLVTALDDQVEIYYIAEWAEREEGGIW